MPSELLQTRRGLIPEDLMRFRWLKEMSISPDGAWLAYTVSQPHGNAYQVMLYIHNCRAGTTLRVSQAPGQASSPAWSHDSQHLAYVYRDSAQTQLIICSPTGQQEQAFAFKAEAPSDLNWSPDGSQIAFSSWVRQQSDTGSGNPDIPNPTIRVVRRLRYKQDGAGWVHDRFRQIFSIQLGNGQLRQLTDGECDYQQPRWSWGGDRIACVAMAREQNIPLGYGQIMILDMNTGVLQPMLQDWQGASLSPCWRADDQAIIFAGHNAPAPINRRWFFHIWHCDLRTGEAHDLSAQIDQTVGNYAVSDQRPGLTNITVKWPGGTGPAWFLLTDHGATHLYQVSPDSPPERIIGGECVMFDYSASENGDLAYGMAHPASVGDLYLHHASEYSAVTALNPWLQDHQLAQPEAYYYTGLDGAQVHGWEIRPPDFDPNKKYPLIVYVHCSMFSWDFNLEFQCLAEAGYVVVAFNARGTTAGYGQDCSLGNYYGKHEAEYAEIMLGVDELVQRPYIDAARMGVTGGSCGGFMTNWIIGQTNRFAAAVTQRSVTELLSKYGTSDNGPEQAESEGGGRPWTNTEQMWRSSPIAYAARIETPLLILHASEDHRCTLSQAEEFYSALRWHGKTVEMVIFEGESHGLTRGGKPGNRIEHSRRILAWFDRYLQ